MTREEFEILVAFVEDQHEQVEAIVRQVADPKVQAQMAAMGMKPPTDEQIAAATKTVKILDRAVELLGEVWNGKKITMKGVSSFARIGKDEARLAVED